MFLFKSFAISLSVFGVSETSANVIGQRAKIQIVRLHWCSNCYYNNIEQVSEEVSPNKECGATLSFTLSILINRHMESPDRSSMC